jgi:hypothetical protein
MDIELESIKNIPEVKEKIKNFDWMKYFVLNPDLCNKMSRTEYNAINHYLSHGFYDNRKYSYSLPKNFNWKQYLEKNPDLLKANINNKALCIRHWLNHGEKEKRQY